MRPSHGSGRKVHDTQALSIHRDVGNRHSEGIVLGEVEALLAQ